MLNLFTNRKVETKLYLLPIGPDIIVYLFGCLIVFKSRSQKDEGANVRFGKRDLLKWNFFNYTRGCQINSSKAST